MPLIVRDLNGGVTATSSGGAAASAWGHLDDAGSITVYVTSSATTGTAAGTLQVSMFDPHDAFPTPGVVQSSQWYTLQVTATGGTAVLTTGNAVTITNISFRGLRIGSLSSAIASEQVAWATKQITV